MTPEFRPIQSSEIENSLLSEVEKYSFLYMWTSADLPGSPSPNVVTNQVDNPLPEAI